MTLERMEERIHGEKSLDQALKMGWRGEEEVGVSPGYESRAACSVY